MEYIKKVKEFMALTGQEMPVNPTIPSQGIQTLRWGLIIEEANELQGASIQKDLVEVADALCDLRYVVEGAFLAYGFSPELADELFSEVHRSNMSKFCHTQEDAERTIDKLIGDEGLIAQAFLKESIDVVEYVMQEVGEYWVVNRVSDNKVMKSVTYSPPDLRSILIKHGVKVD